MMLPTGILKTHKIRSAGFTLVEVLVVTLLIVILATLATPRFQGVVTNMRLKNQAKAIGQVVRLTHMRAQTDGIVHRVEIDDEHGVQILRQRSGNRWDLVETVSVSGDLLFEPRQRAIHFYPDGRYTQARLILQGANDVVYEIIPTFGLAEVRREN